MQECVCVCVCYSVYMVITIYIYHLNYHSNVWGYWHFITNASVEKCKKPLYAFIIENIRSVCVCVCVCV